MLLAFVYKGYNSFYTLLMDNRLTIAKLLKILLLFKLMIWASINSRVDFKEELSNWETIALAIIFLVLVLFNYLC